MRGALPASQPVQAFTAVVWTTTTLHSREGKAATFSQRTVFTRDSLGNISRRIYQPTKGLQHNTGAPLLRIVTGTRVANDISSGTFNHQVLSSDTNLGTATFQGYPAQGHRQVMRDVNGGLARAPWKHGLVHPLGLTVHMERREPDGDSVVSDLSELSLGDPATSSETAPPASAPAVPTLTLYRSFFNHVAHLERDKHENDPNRHVNLQQIEDHLAGRLAFSGSEWEALVNSSEAVDRYTRDMTDRARRVAAQAKADQRSGPMPML